MYDGSTDCRSSLASEKSMMDRLQKLNLAAEEWEYIEAAAQKKGTESSSKYLTVPKWTTEYHPAEVRQKVEEPQTSCLWT